MLTVIALAAIALAVFAYQLTARPAMPVAITGSPLAVAVETQPLTVMVANDALPVTVTNPVRSARIDFDGVLPVAVQETSGPAFTSAVSLSTSRPVPRTGLDSTREYTRRLGHPDQKMRKLYEDEARRLIAGKLTPGEWEKLTDQGKSFAEKDAKLLVITWFLFSRRDAIDDKEINEYDTLREAWITKSNIDDAYDAVKKLLGVTEDNLIRTRTKE
jgi:hypothetical protein